MTKSLKTFNAVNKIQVFHFRMFSPHLVHNGRWLSNLIELNSKICDQGLILDLEIRWVLNLV